MISAPTPPSPSPPHPQVPCIPRSHARVLRKVRVVPVPKYTYSAACTAERTWLALLKVARPQTSPQSLHAPSHQFNHFIQNTLLSWHQGWSRWPRDAHHHQTQRADIFLITNSSICRGTIGKFTSNLTHHAPCSAHDPRAQRTNLFPPRPPPMLDSDP